MKLDLLTNATAVDDAITFVYQSKEKLRKSTSKNVDQQKNFLLQDCVRLVVDTLFGYG